MTDNLIQWTNILRFNFTECEISLGKLASNSGLSSINNSD